MSDFLQIPDYDKPWRIEPDGSGFAIGGVLSQKDQKGKWHPVAFLSKGMSPAERNYDIYDRELLAMIRCLEEWRYYLLRSPHTIEIWSDHLNLTWFKQPQNLNRRQARWMTYLQQFDINLRHKPGKLMVAADALSRRPGHDQGKEDNQNMTVLPENLFNRHIIVSTIYDSIRNASTSTTIPDGLKERNGLFWKNKQVFVPQTE